MMFGQEEPRSAPRARISAPPPLPSGDRPRPALDKPLGVRTYVPAKQPPADPGTALIWIAIAAMMAAAAIFVAIVAHLYGWRWS